MSLRVPATAAAASTACMRVSYYSADTFQRFASILYAIVELSLSLRRRSLCCHSWESRCYESASAVVICTAERPLRAFLVSWTIENLWGVVKPTVEPSACESLSAQQYHAQGVARAPRAAIRFSISLEEQAFTECLQGKIPDRKCARSH